MKFGTFLLDDALGGVLAHSLRLPGLSLRKGHRLVEADVDALRTSGARTVTITRLEPGDIPENEAAAALAAALDGAGLRLGAAGSGRVNIHAKEAGLFAPDRTLVDALNRVGPSITLATLAEDTPVTAGNMVATIKIIPFAVSKADLDSAIAVAAQRSALVLHPFRARGIALVQTELDGTKPSVLDKTRTTLAARLDILGSSLDEEHRCRHDIESLAAVIERCRQKLVVIFGASAVTDEADVVPSAIRASGGTVLHLGMPVDPGNMLGLAVRGAQTIIVAPGCARSPAPNGFDLVLARVMADRPVGSVEIMGMGVGGLLKG